MVLIFRILFGTAALVLFFYVGLFLGTWFENHTLEPRPERIKNLAYVFNTLLLAVFFTLWCVKKGVI